MWMQRVKRRSVAVAAAAAVKRWGSVRSLNNAHFGQFR